MNDKSRMLILNPTCLDVLDGHRDYLNAQHVEWVADPTFRSLKPEQVDEVLAGAHALVLPASIRNLPLAEHMQRHSTLQVLSIAASGYDWLDVESATRNGIVVTYAPVREGIEVVADMTWGLMFAVARQIPYHHLEIRAGRYERGMGVSVWSKTLGIVGLGKIGQAVARRARGFDMKILAAEPNPDVAFVQEHGIELVNLDELLLQSDFVSLHVRLNSETSGMIGARELGLMKPSGYLINTARIELLDETALTQAIVDGQIAGAGLDDPPGRVDSPLLDLPNVVYTPHLGNRAIEGVHAVFRCAIDNALVVLAGEQPALTVNPEVYDGPLRTAMPKGSR